jgi:hypothetical protein
MPTVILGTVGVKGSQDERRTDTGRQGVDWSLPVGATSAKPLVWAGGGPVADPISVIVSTRTREEASATALCSLARQTSPGFEGIVADDSSESSAAFVEAGPARVGRRPQPVWHLGGGFSALAPERTASA